MRIKRFVQTLCIAIFCLTGAPVAAEDVRLTLPEGRTMAARLIEAQRPQEALLIVEGILSGKPEDPPALILKSRALRDMDESEAALETAQQAWSAAAEDEDKFFAALVMAQARASAGQQALGQFWLRRAVQIAPNDGLESIARRDFQQLRRLTPWRIHLDLRTERDDNVNNAPKLDGFVGTGLRPQRLEGLRLRATGRFTYGIVTSARSKTHLDITAGAARVRPIGDLWDQLNIDPSEYDEARLGFGLRRDWVSADGRAMTEIGASVDRFWFGGALGVDNPALWVSHRRAFNPTLVGSATLRRSGLTRHYARNGNSVSHSLSFGLQKALPKAQVGFQIDLLDSAAQADPLAHRDLRGRLTWSARQARFGLLPRFSVAYTKADYVGGSPLSDVNGPRRDRIWDVALDVTLPELHYFGFAPTVGVSFRDQESNYIEQRRRGTDIRLGLTSVF